MSDATRHQRLAFVLLSQPTSPHPADVVGAFERMLPAGATVRLKALRTDAPGPNGRQVDEYRLGNAARVMISPMPSAVPNGEAEWHAERSVQAVLEGWRLPPHRAHVVVWMDETEAVPLRDSLQRYTWLLAAVTQAANAVAVYWAASGATHPAAAFVKLASQGDLAGMMPLWSGVSVGSDGPDRVSLLSLGMRQLDLPDLELTASRTTDKIAAVGMFFDLLLYVAERGSPIPEGDTVGRDAKERLRVRYVPSPIEPERKVWRVDLP